MAGIDEEEQDGDTAGAGGDKKKIPNAKRRSLQEFLLKAPTTKLSYSKRCGKLVTAFIRELMPWAENFESDPMSRTPRGSGTCSMMAKDGSPAWWRVCRGTTAAKGQRA